MDIPEGTFVCQYLGEIITDDEANNRVHHNGSTYLFDLDLFGKSDYTVDAHRYGNIARFSFSHLPLLSQTRITGSLSPAAHRFINHSCEPNLRTMGVMLDEVDPKLHKIALFTSKEIKTGQELSFDYEGVINGPFDVGDDVNRANNGRDRKQANTMECFCASESCRKHIML